MPAVKNQNAGDTTQKISAIETLIRREEENEKRKTTSGGASGHRKKWNIFLSSVFFLFPMLLALVAAYPSCVYAHQCRSLPLPVHAPRERSALALSVELVLVLVLARTLYVWLSAECPCVRQCAPVCVVKTSSLGEFLYARPNSLVLVCVCVPVELASVCVCERKLLSSSPTMSVLLACHSPLAAPTN